MQTTPTGFPSGPPLSRRRALVRAGQGVLVLVGLGAAVSACGSAQAPEPDPLEAELAAARADAALAYAAAKAGPPTLAPALRVIGDERTRHAAALVEELARAAGRPTPDPDSAEATPAPSAAPPASSPPPGVRAVAEALRRSADSATSLVPTLSGYRAGLLGSIAASCTASFTVGLDPERGQR